MHATSDEPAQPSGLRLLLDHFSRVEDKRSPESVAHRLNEILLVCVCATIAECDSFDAISDWGQAHLEVLRRFLPFVWGVPPGQDHESLTCDHGGSEGGVDCGFEAFALDGDFGWLAGEDVEDGVAHHGEIDWGI